ncbi:AlbA family DNA-binding domain-containing protein [Polaribacter sp.]|uniref:AlbA family DNA-binding domain-containing protein n=1 Tax=Polaribacter sp. TaxID=1920175 RepID=UPI0040471AEC
MSTFNPDITSIISQPESEVLEYKAVLPPSRTLAQLISGLANTSGGNIVLGVNDSTGKVEINGLSEDFRANSILHKAIDLLSARPEINYAYSKYQNKNLYVIQVSASTTPISVEGKIYVRQGTSTIVSNPTQSSISNSTYSQIKEAAQKLLEYNQNSTAAMSKFNDHYKSVLNIVADLKKVLYTDSPSTPTTNEEGRILMRILFSSCADNIETYLSDLLYEIYLAKPESLKTKEQTVTIKEVLDCSDIQEFIIYYAKKKLSKLQRGSIKGFISENKQLSSLNVISQAKEEHIDKILQIRHLYAHKNGIVDEKFLQHFPDEYAINDSHEMSLDTFLTHINYLASIANTIDKAAIQKYNLATL